MEWRTAAELWGNFDTEQGSIVENIAIPWMELTQDLTVDRVAFVEHDNGKIGCSPDGLIGLDGGVEAKCPQAVTQIKYLLAQELPKEYRAQVHFSLYVTGRQWWKFLSYRRHFPELLLHIERDEEIMQKIESALNAYYLAFDAAMAKLKSFK